MDLSFQPTKGFQDQGICFSDSDRVCNHATDCWAQNITNEQQGKESPEKAVRGADWPAAALLTPWLHHLNDHERKKIF